ncbi:DUF6702 family protein [Algibacter sp. AS12]|uniref:DUF6702 family protein n=1 Tax=Algibacter sp. AS12 TaxID=3135773 RepID=UPI00398B3989
MRLLILICIAFFNFSNMGVVAHDSVSATFNVIERGHVLMLEIDFDMDNYLKINPSNNAQVTKANFSTYLNKTTRWEIDGETLIPQVLSLKEQGHHSKVICLLSETTKEIKTVKITNEFLIAIHDHSNIIKLDINDSFKDFRLYKKRKTVEVIYN